MKGTRRIQLSESFLATHQLNSDKPAADSLFWKMWEAGKDIANKTLSTKFIEGIKNGTLDPGTYGAFNISDAYYCFHGAEDYKTAVGRASDLTLKAFLEKKQKSYESFNATFPKTWRVKDTSSIVPTDACKQYANYESSIVTNEEPIYCLVVMLPCEYLWAWLGATLSPAKPDNLYASWISGNNDPSGAYTMGNFIEIYRQYHSLDEDKAIEIYKTAMEHELLNFQSATD